MFGDKGRRWEKGEGEKEEEEEEEGVLRRDQRERA